MATDPVLQEYNYQQALQQQQMQNQMSMSLPYNFQNQQEHQSLLVEQTNPNKVIDEIELSLRGFERKIDGGLKKVSDPMMNDLGISRMRFLMRGVINQNTILSHLEEREIGKIIIQLSDDIVDDLTLNWRDYAVQDKIMLDHIVDAIIFPAFFALKRALGQNEKNWLSKISVENISNAPRIPNPKREGFWGKFKL